jgi:hypothetical protein
MKFDPIKYVFLIIGIFVALFLWFLFLNKDSILSLIIPNYQNNGICNSYEIKASKLDYEIPVTKNLKNKLHIKVDSWGGFNRGYRSLGKDVDPNICAATTSNRFNTKTREKVSENTLITIRDSDDRILTKFNMDIYIYLDINTLSNNNIYYDAEKIIENLANRFEVKREGKDLTLRTKIFKPDEIVDPSGDWVIQEIEGFSDNNYGVINLISNDNGNSWKFKQVDFVDINTR